ncbi:MAG: FKBP-type peptidyl-prolyl cis-trans isomerase [Bacteroidales bacterium]|nr:FKBP-type peptidyl-prolyl cis-trans isomerase [Bacteroidales bacterium]
MRRYSLLFYFSFFLTFFIFNTSCTETNKEKTHKTKKELDAYNKSLETANRYLTTLDAERIANYAKRRKWNMTETKSGIWYEIYEKGSGPKAKEGQVAVLNYTISLLDGTLCYTSDSLGSKDFAIGHGGVESGLEEGILLLHKGDKARIIMPPFKAHGLLGDMDKIPARSIIVYELELINLID